MGTADVTGLDRLEPRDREYVESLDDPELRETIVGTLARYRRPNRMEVGVPVPALDLFPLEGGDSVPLRSLCDERPLALVFGSYTWPPFRRRSGDVESLYRRFRDEASIYFVYVAEAHAVDEWQMESNEAEGVLLHQHATLEDRFAAAREGASRLRLTLPVLVDGMDNAVSEAFAAWPERIFVAGRDSRIAFAGGPGPWEFDPDAASAALERILGLG